MPRRVGAAEDDVGAGAVQELRVPACDLLGKPIGVVKALYADTYMYVQYEGVYIHIYTYVDAYLHICPYVYIYI